MYVWVRFPHSAYLAKIFHSAIIRSLVYGTCRLYHCFEYVHKPACSRCLQYLQYQTVIDINFNNKHWREKQVNNQYKLIVEFELFLFFEEKGFRSNMKGILLFIKRLVTRSMDEKFWTVAVKNFGQYFGQYCKYTVGWLTYYF